MESVKPLKVDKPKRGIEKPIRGMTRVGDFNKKSFLGLFKREKKT